MRKLINYFICLLAASGLSQAAGAQELTSNTEKINQNELLPTDSTMNQRMETDLNKRNSLTNNQRVSWKQSLYGYNGTYFSNHVQYMAHYDKDGKYVETFTKKEWNENASAKLRSSYDQSNYRSQRVTGYWEVTDPGRKGYYLELKDDQNKSSRVWVNEDGKFSTSPSYLKSGTKIKGDGYLVPDSTVEKDH